MLAMHTMVLRTTLHGKVEVKPRLAVFIPRVSPRVMSTYAATGRTKLYTRRVIPAMRQTECLPILASKLRNGRPPAADKKRKGIFCDDWNARNQPARQPYVLLALGQLHCTTGGRGCCVRQLSSHAKK